MVKDEFGVRNKDYGQGKKHFQCYLVAIGKLSCFKDGFVIVDTRTIQLKQTLNLSSHYTCLHVNSFSNWQLYMFRA